MQIIKYMPDCYPELHAMALQLELRSSGLRHQPFVDYYYTANDWCDLFLLLDDRDRLIGTVGVEKMPFLYGSRPVTLGSGNNYFVLHKGAGHGDILFRKWVETCDFGITFGGSADAHRIYRKYRWDYFDGVKVYSLNESLTPYPGEAAWRVAAKWLLGKLPRVNINRRLSRIQGSEINGLSLLEEKKYTEDMLPQRFPFLFRFTPSTNYLAWRYRTDLSFVRYRTFRILNAMEETAGYIILNQSKRRVIVSHCDGEDPATLAYGVLLSLGKVARDFEKDPEVWLASSHPIMKRIYTRFGFKPASPDRPFTIGSLSRHSGIEPDTANWLVNLDWGDNGLRIPFLDQV